MKAAFHTLGCKVNSYETQAMLEQFKAEGFDIVDFTENADAYIINTCSVTGMAEHKSRQMIHRARRLNPDAVIVAAGCYAQRAAEELMQDGTIDLVIGNNHKSDIAKLVMERMSFAGPSPSENDTRIIVDDLSRCHEFERQQITSLGENVRAYIKIQDGCNRFCSYCIIPYVRGRSRCRSREDIVNEARSLSANGYREVVLTGIDISTYDDLIGLIEAVNEIEGINRIRLGSLEVSVITEDFVRRFAALEKACPHFHLSLQSGCDETLKRMNRHYTTEEYAAGAELIRSVMPGCSITTDVIVGFPGETDEEFEKSLEFVRKTAFFQTHVFKYSRRAGTAADRMKDQIPEQIKNLRSSAMIEATDLIHRGYEEQLQGSIRQVLLEEETVTADGKAVLTGFTPEYVRTAVVKAAGLKPGMITDVRILGFSETENGRILLAGAEHLY